jgi:membrane fusion protein (multidrug efflux system)
MSVEAATNQAEPPLVETASTPAPAPNRGRRGAIGIGFLLVVLIAAGLWYVYSKGTEDTDDAQVDGHLVPIASRIDGTIQSVKVDDNAIVEQGQLLIELDPRDNQVALDQAKAQFNQAAAQLGAAGPNLPITRISNASDQAADSAEVAAAEAALAASRQDLAGSLAKLKESQAVNERAQANFQRYQSLLDRNEVARAEYDQYKATADAQVQTIAANQAAVSAAEQVVKQREAQLELQKSKLQQSLSSAPLQLSIRDADIKSQRANTDSAKSMLEKAGLNLTYGTLTAPVSGVVTQRSAEPGERVSSGQQLLMIVQTDGLWITANFKETQLARMHPGQHAKVHIDALGKDFNATVESMPAVTGSRTSVLPPENATGNYVKVIQRMPVRLHLDAGQNDLDKLRPGMSAEPKVHVE